MSTPLRARVLLADDHALVRAGLRAVLNLEPDLDVVAEAGDGAAAVRAALRTSPDLAVLDLTMPVLTGLQAARQIREHRPATHVVLLSMHDNEQYILEARDAGARGYVLKASAERELVDTLRAVMRGEPFVFPRDLPPVTLELLERADRTGPCDLLTPRETEIAKLVAEGHSSRTIAGILHISERTVERHRSNIFEKLGIHDRVALTRYAIRQGLTHA